MKKILILLFLLPSFYLNSLQTKIDTTKIKKIYKLHAIKVIAKKPEEAIGYIESEPLKTIKQNTKLTLDETIDELSGIDVSVGGKNGSYLTVRGFNENQIKILVDGQPISPSYMDAVDLTTLPTEFIKEIQLLKGPASSIYGTNTMGGILNIITKEPSKNFIKKIGISIKRNNTNKIYAFLSKKFQFANLLLSFSRFHSDGLVLSNKFTPTDFEDGHIKENDTKTSYNLNSSIDFTINDFHKIGLKFSYDNSPLKEITPKVFEAKYSKFLKWHRYHIGTIAHFQLLYNLTLENSIYYDSQSDTYAQYKDKYYHEMEQGWPSYLTSTTWGINTKLDWEKSNNILITTGLIFEKAFYKRKDYANYTNWTSNNTNLLYYYLQSKLNFDKLTFTLGNGFSYYFLNSLQNSHNHFEPSIGVYYKYSNSLKFSIASGINTHYPTLRQLFDYTYGNKNLKEESAWKNEFMVEKKIIYKNLPLKTNFVIFYNKIHNLIKKIGDTNENIGKIVSYGFETEYYFSFRKLDSSIKYSYITYSKNSDIQLIGEPKNKISISEKILLTKNFSLLYQFVWKDKRLFLYDNHYILLPTYSLHSIFLQKNIKKWNIILGVTNIFDKNYFMQYGYPGEGINFNLSIQVEL